MGDLFVRLMSWFVSELRTFTTNGKRRDALSADGRKVALAVGIAGFLGPLSGQVSLLTSAAMVLLGAAAWFFSARLIRDDKEGD